MRRKQQVQIRLEAIVSGLELTARALQGRQLTAEQVLHNINKLISKAKHMEELIDLEDQL